MYKNSYNFTLIKNCLIKHRNGQNVQLIISQFNIPRSTIYYWIKKYKHIKNLEEIKYISAYENEKKKNQKLLQINQVLKLVNCTVHSPLQTKLKELEKLYGKFSVRVLCEALNVSRGTFYNHILRNKKEKTSYAKRRKILSDEILKIYEESRGLFGSDKIVAVLETKGFHTSKPLVRELMKEMGLRSFRSTAKRDHSLWNKLHPPKNYLQRNFNVKESNQVWASDCTRISYKQQSYHICVIMDLYSRKIISYKISQRASTQLVTSAFNEALSTRNHCAPKMFHSDIGCQYTSFAFRKLLLKHNILQSFSHSGNPYDNGVVESFFSSFKQEEIYRSFYSSVKQFKQRIGEYIKFYNQDRPHRANNYKTPNQKEEAYYNKINREV